MLSYSYSPVVKGKKYDLLAYSQALKKTPSKMKALIDVLPSPSGTVIDQHITKLIKEMEPISVDADLFVDFYGLMPGAKTSVGEIAVVAGYRELWESNRYVTPVYGFGRDDSLWPHLLKCVQKHNSGFCFRIEIEDLDDEAENTWDQILTRSAQLQLAYSKIDLFIDLRDVRTADVDELQERVTDFLALCPLGIVFRSICVAGCSVSKDVTTVARDTVGGLYRNELKLWARLKSDVPACSMLVYGDYGIVHPDFAENVKCGATMNCKIRYTAGAYILIFRGHVRKGDSGQTHALAAQVVSHPAYQGPTFSDGDGYIAKCAVHATGPGAPATWVFVDLNHHYVYVACQINRLISEIEFDTSDADLDVLLEQI